MISGFEVYHLIKGLKDSEKYLHVWFLSPLFILFATEFLKTFSKICLLSYLLFLIIANCQLPLNFPPSVNYSFGPSSVLVSPNILFILAIVIVILPLLLLFCFGSSVSCLFFPLTPLATYHLSPMGDTSKEEAIR